MLDRPMLSIRKHVLPSRRSKSPSSELLSELQRLQSELKLQSCRTSSRGVLAVIVDVVVGGGHAQSNIDIIETQAGASLGGGYKGGGSWS